LPDTIILPVSKTLFLINKLENVQIEAARVVTGGTRLVSINSLYKETGWETLQARRENHKKNYFYKMVNGLVPPYLIRSMRFCQLPLFEMSKPRCLCSVT
jgi:hypothetical protein